MGRFTTGILAGTIIGVGAAMMMDPKTRKRSRRMRRDGVKLMSKAGDWVEDIVDMYR